MKEVGAVLGMSGEVIYWHEPDGASGGSLPDSTKLWEVIWDAFKRGQFSGFAHSHPGGGWPGPSHTDLTTFRAIEQALGIQPVWWICSADRLIALRRARHPGGFMCATHTVEPITRRQPNAFVDQREIGADYVSANVNPGLGEDVLAPWVGELRRRSGYARASQQRMDSLACPPGFFCPHEPRCPGAGNY